MPLQRVIRRSYIHREMRFTRREKTMDAVAASVPSADRVRLHIGSKHPPFHGRFAVSQEHRSSATRRRRPVCSQSWGSRRWDCLPKTSKQWTTCSCT